MSAFNLSPMILAASYELLRSTKPFNRWHLPQAQNIRFRVYRSKAERGQLEREGERLIIGVSEHSNGHLYSLLETLAHEMVHLRMILLGMRSWNAHGVHFERLARQVCAAHGFDLKAF